ncbi:DNA replication and repair protein RecF [Fulvimonas soli]|uniref:DNA replication and repair protein RecF n=2 Tax=Fulvimonas soli TaxID=155197 RepID=A0A316IHD1_9GAMM|nr:DNA replication and repair protein RecF [Fulvimonas soli]
MLRRRAFVGPGMRLLELQVRHLRSFGETRVELAPGINVFHGPNGAGKTTLLEAVFLLSHGRSFRSGAREALLQRGAEGFTVFAEWEAADGWRHRLGLGREKSRWEARLDGELVSLGTLVRHCAVICFEPGSHALIAGGAEERRRYLDWGVFHVEQDFLAPWRRYQRALKQRNALLRAGTGAPAEYLPWESELADCAEAIDAARRRYLDLLRPELVAAMQGLLPELGEVELRYRSGWPDGVPLAGHLAAQRGRDQARGHTGAGSHRADWELGFAAAPQREHLSRGQEKLTALGCLLAQAALYARLRGEWPVICLDDLASELDGPHQQAVVDRLVAAGAQVLVTGTELPPALAPLAARVFHVEQGRVAGLL